MWQRWFGAVVLIGVASVACANGWPDKATFNRWSGKVLKNYADPAIKCNKVTSLSSPKEGAIKVNGVWCSGQMVGKFIGGSIAQSFRRETGYKGKLRVDIYGGGELIARETY